MSDLHQQINDTMVDDFVEKAPGGSVAVSPDFWPCDLTQAFEASRRATHVPNLART